MTESTENDQTKTRVRIKRAVAIGAVLGCMLALSGCQQSEESLKHDAAFAKQCHDAGGQVYYVGIGNDQIRCDFSPSGDGW